MPKPIILKQFFTETGSVVPAPQDIHFKEYARLLPKKGAVSFLLDLPFTPYNYKREDLYAAQIFFVPLLINPMPEEKFAITYCSNQEIANFRMIETGYFFLDKTGDGKGVAIKL
jgi:hypothetical protein